MSGTTQHLTPALDGARILWRYFRASDDSRANEGHVREFTGRGDYARIAATCYNDDSGEWLRCADLVVVAVLQEHAAVIERPRRRRRRPEGEEA